ncbi:hypothetical protein PVAP13_9NG538300 [Panicum virgatum]|uniref:Uncharacterized protein n=1 Tax=Panicum virgatum TaxID=38727 RepID=A0A8T0MS10_PANVG|nr:hypothetical protein PVAP13_9NG538300 [Panicum virgatum]
MIFSKLRRVALTLVFVILLSSNHVMYSQGKPLAMMHRRFSLLSHSDEATKGTVTRGTISPDGTGNGAAGGGGVLGEDTRATDPGHSPGAGHAATNNEVGRKLLGVN